MSRSAPSAEPAWRVAQTYPRYEGGAQSTSQSVCIAASWQCGVEQPVRAAGVMRVEPNPALVPAAAQPEAFDAIPCGYEFMRVMTTYREMGVTHWLEKAGVEMREFA